MKKFPNVLNIQVLTDPVLNALNVSHFCPNALPRSFSGSFLFPANKYTIVHQNSVSLIAFDSRLYFLLSVRLRFWEEASALIIGDSRFYIESWYRAGVWSVTRDGRAGRQKFSGRVSVIIQLAARSILYKERIMDQGRIAVASRTYNTKGRPCIWRRGHPHFFYIFTFSFAFCYLYYAFPPPLSLSACSAMAYLHLRPREFCGCAAAAALFLDERSLLSYYLFRLLYTWTNCDFFLWRFRLLSIWSKSYVYRSSSEVH